MKSLVCTSSIVLACCASASAQSGSTDESWLPESVRGVFDDPNGGLGRLAKGVLGPGGVDAWFYLPTRDEPATPADRGYRFDEVRFTSADGTPLHGWFLPAKTKASMKPKGTVVFSHGNAGSLGYHLGLVTWLVDAGYHVFMYDYRGFGKSGGEVDRRGMVGDVRAAFERARRLPQVDPQRLISYGHSMGGAKSIAAIADEVPQGLRAVVVDGAFASYRAMARVAAGRLGEQLASDELAPIDHVDRVSPLPLLIVHGTRDAVVPVSQGRELFAKAAEPKTWMEIPGAGHNDALAAGGGDGRHRMLAWLDDQLRGKPRAKQ